MQTFLPYTDFIKSARCLDFKRLGKQRVEAKQIIDILTGESKSNAWKNHPAVLMWKDNVDTLRLYHDIMIAEWVSRGYKNTMKFLCGDPIVSTLLTTNYQGGGFFDNPEWLTDEFCSFHRATLLSKNYDWYSQFNWTEEPKYGYLWNENKGE